MAQAAAGYGAKNSPTPRDVPTTGGPTSNNRAMPDTGALSGTRNDDLPAGARDTNLNPPAITQSESNMGGGGGDIDVNPPQALVIQQTALEVVPVPVMVTPDVSSDTVRMVCIVRRSR